MCELNNLQDSVIPPPFPAGLEARGEGNSDLIGSITERYETVTEKRCDKLSVDDPYPQFPDELKALPRWVLWKSTKIPFDQKPATQPTQPTRLRGPIIASSGKACWVCRRGPRDRASICAIDLDKCRNAGVAKPRRGRKQLSRK